MEEHLVYVLYSSKHDKLYCGVTSDLIKRFNSHNLLGIRDWTKAYRPWIVVHVELFLTRSEALEREKSLKSGKGREWIRSEILPHYL